MNFLERQHNNGLVMVAQVEFERAAMVELSIKWLDVNTSQNTLGLVTEGAIKDQFQNVYSHVF